MPRPPGAKRLPIAILGRTDTCSLEKTVSGNCSQPSAPRLRAGEGVGGRFFGMNNAYLFIGEHKYRLMSDYAIIDPCRDKTDYVLNRARLCRHGRDCSILPRRL